MSENQNQLNDFLKNVDELGCNALTVSRKVLVDGKEEVTLNLARKKIMPDRMESPARYHEFHEVPGFIEYLRKEKNPGMVIFANVGTSRIIAVIDDKAEKGFENIALEPQYHPEFELLENTLLGKELSIFEFAKNLMRNRNVFDAGTEKAKQLALLMRQITVSTKVTACVGVGAKSVNGIMCTTEAKAGLAESQIDLPDSIAVKLPIYLNTEPVSFDIDLTISATRDGSVMVQTDCPELQVRKYEVFETIIEQVREIKDVLVTLGRPNTTEWKYNR